ncbi:MAG: ECF-type sigma factor [Planctomycetota bacterium]
MKSPSMAEIDSVDVTLWVRAMEDGDDAAATRLFGYCFPRLLRFARSRLPDRFRRSLDEEDVALSAFHSFCTAAAAGGLGTIENRDSLWKLLMCITARKGAQHLRSETREKRGGGQVRGESVFCDAEGNSNAGINDASASKADTPIDLESFQQQCCDLLEQLDKPELQTIALMRLQGYGVEEIAKRIPCAQRSVERRLNLIRQIWKQ